MTIQQDGYGIVRGIFPLPFMDMLERTLGTKQRASIDLVMEHRRVRHEAHKLMGAVLERTGEEHVNFEPAGKLYNSWHADAPWVSHDGAIIPVWRFAVYFRDYTTHSGGLGVVPGSHLGPLLPAITVQPVAVQSRRGDLVVWNLRTLHRAGMTNGTLPVGEPRNAIFFDYGAPGVELDRYVTWRRARTYKKETA